MEAGALTLVLGGRLAAKNWGHASGRIARRANHARARWTRRRSAGPGNAAAAALPSSRVAAEDELSDDLWAAALADPEGEASGELLADPELLRALLRRAAALEREHSDLTMLHDATLDHSNEIEEELALKIEEIESLVRDLEVRNSFIRAIFGRYLSDDVVTTLLESPEALRLGGERRRVTILFSDLRGFSGISERLSPEQVVTLLNIYLGGMAAVIDAYRGSINEFIGDGILIVFGAPLELEDAAARAVACALAMQAAMAEINATCAAQGLPTLEMGIGAHTGEVIVGNIGSKRRAKYALVGRNVNLASRVETYTVGGQVLISDSTAVEIGDALDLSASFRVRPKGFRDELVLHEVAAIRGAYEVSLPTRRDELRALASPVAVRLSVLEGKDAGGPELRGEIVAVGELSALVECEEPLEPLSNLKIELPAGIVDGGVYAKVLAAGERAGAARIRFTPATEALIAGLRAAGASA